MGQSKSGVRVQNENGTEDGHSGTLGVGDTWREKGSEGDWRHCQKIWRRNRENEVTEPKGREFQEG